MPGKPLRAICGQPMIAWVYQRVHESRRLDRLLVATDAEEIAAFCRGANIPVVMTSRAHCSGTDRILEVMTREPAGIVVNIQGDEPMVTAAHIELLLRPFGEDAGTQVTTLMVPTTAEAARDPNMVKVVTNPWGQALYFSRAPIPFDRDGRGAALYKHLGFYAYTAEALKEFGRRTPSRLEQVERLEQLRFLENGIGIRVIETNQDTVGVDTEEDLRRVEEYFRHAAAL